MNPCSRVPFGVARLEAQAEIVRVGYADELEEAERHFVLRRVRVVVDGCERHSVEQAHLHVAPVLGIEMEVGVVGPR